MNRASVAGRVSIALTAWLGLAYGVAPVSFAIFAGEELPGGLCFQFELHAIGCAVGLELLSEAVPRLRPFADSLLAGSFVSGVTVTPVGWAVVATTHVLIGGLAVGLGTISLGAMGAASMTVNALLALAATVGGTLALGRLGEERRR